MAHHCDSEMTAHDDGDTLFSDNLGALDSHFSLEFSGHPTPTNPQCMESRGMKC
jgi:hypothetical protein